MGSDDYYKTVRMSFITTFALILFLLLGSIIDGCRLDRLESALAALCAEAQVSCEVSDAE